MKFHLDNEISRHCITEAVVCFLLTTVRFIVIQSKQMWKCILCREYGYEWGESCRMLLIHLLFLKTISLRQTLAFCTRTMERHLAGKTCSPTDSGCNDTNLFEKLLLEKRVLGESLQIILLELGPIGKCFPNSGRQTLGGNYSCSRGARLHLTLATELPYGAGFASMKI